MSLNLNALVLKDRSSAEESAKGKLQLLLLHGWGQNLLSLLPLGELLSNHGEVHLLDLPGFGQSDIPPLSEGNQSWGTGDYCRRVLQYIDENKLNGVIVLGHSFGGRIAIRLASDYPDKVKGLVLISSAGLKRSFSWQRKIRFKLQSLLRRLIKACDRIFKSKLFEDWYIPRYASPDYKNSGRLRGVLVRTVNEDLTESAKKVSCPTLLVWGSADTETPIEMAYRLNSLIRSSELVELPGVGHLPFLNAGSHLLCYVIRPFLQRLSGS